MHYAIRSLLCLLVVLFCGSVLADTKSDAELRTRLVGRWQELRDLVCESHQQVMYMRSNGTFEVNGVIRSCESIRQFIWKGTWTVKNGKMKYKTTYSSPKDEFPLGEEWEDEIVSVSSNEWVMREESTGNESRAFRLK